MPTSVYKVVGTARPAISTSKGPGALSLAEKTNLLKAIGLPGPGTVYVTLSPSRPGVTNHAALAFERPRVLDGWEDYATWRLWDPDTEDVKQLRSQEGTGVKRLGIWFKSEAAGRRYLVVCAVMRGAPDLGGSDNLTQAFTVSRPDGSHLLTSSVPPGGGHVAFGVETQDASWYGFMLASEFTWTFWSCEITRL